MADFSNSTTAPETATRSQLLDLADSLDNARFRVTVARLAVTAAVAPGDERNALSMLFLDLEQLMAELCRDFDRLVMAPIGECVQ